MRNFLTQGIKQLKVLLNPKNEGLYLELLEFIGVAEIVAGMQVLHYGLEKVSKNFVGLFICRHDADRDFWFLDAALNYHLDVPSSRSTLLLQLRPKVSREMLP
jgi:hypothetical protein